MGILTWTWPLFHPSSTQDHAFQGGLSSSRKEGCRVKRVLYGWIAGRSGPGCKQRTCELTSLEGFKAACQPCPEVPNWLPVYLPLHGTDSHLFLCIWKSVCFFYGHRFVPHLLVLERNEDHRPWSLCRLPLTGVPDPGCSGQGLLAPCPLLLHFILIKVDLSRGQRLSASLQGRRLLK